MKKTAIITLTYNKLEQATKPFLNSLYEFTPEKDFDLVIVDNNSTDDTVKYIKEFQKKYSNITLICNEENLGYSKGNNIGINQVIDKSYEFIGLLNNDILFTPDWLSNTIKSFDIDEQLGMISPRNNEKCKLTPKNYLSGYKKYLSKFKTPLKYVVTPFFSCVIVKKEVIDKIGLFDEAFSPAFWEDNDLSFRAMYCGYSLAYTNFAFIFHNHSTTSSSVPSEISERNKRYFFKKHPLGRYIWEHKRTNLIKDMMKYIKESFDK
ncbi:glycosyltransferase family 2 protein [bacterium]|nr:glycosyltransferase family 2 protein [bacterium]